MSMDLFISATLILAIIAGLWRYSWYLGYKACEKQMRKDFQIGGKEFSERYQHLDKYL